MNLDRRRLIKAAGSIALIAGISRSPLFAAPLGANPFTLGVASGDPWPDGFVIWTRLAPRPLDEHGGMPAAHVPVRWEVAEDHGFSRVVRKGETMEHVEGHAYAEISGGSRDGMFINTSGNVRNGQTFVLVRKNGKEYHIYGTGKDRLVVGFHMPSSTPADDTGGTDATPKSGTSDIKLRKGEKIEPVPGHAYAGGGEGDLRVLVHREEVVAAQVAVALLVAGVDAGGLDGHLDLGVLELLAGGDRGALELVERAADLGHHRVPGDEAQAAVGRVDGVAAGEVGERGGGVGGGGHLVELLNCWGISLVRPDAPSRSDSR